MSKQQLIKHSLPVLSREEEQILFAKVAGGCKESRDLAIRHNIPLAVNLASKYFIDGYTFDDIVSIATIAMIRAVDDFDCSRGLKFSTMATMYMWREIWKEKKRYRVGNGVKFRDSCEGGTPFPGIMRPFSSLDAHAHIDSDGEGGVLSETVPCYSSMIDNENIDHGINVQLILDSVSSSDREFAKWIIDENPTSEWARMTGETRPQMALRRRRIKDAMVEHGCID